MDSALRTAIRGLLSGCEEVIPFKRPVFQLHLEREFAGGKKLLRYGANDLVTLAEAKLRGEKVDAAAVAEAARGLVLQARGNEIDTVVLACTHFPLLERELGEAFGPGVRFVHGAHGIARRVAQLVEGQPMTRTVPDRAVTTGSLENFEKVRGPLSQMGLDRLEVL